MLFNSFTFLAFFPIALAGAWLLRGSAWKLWILGTSYVFYGSWDPRFLILMIGSTTVDFFTAQKIEDAPTEKRRRFWLVLSLCVNLGILAFFKYANFFLDSLDVVLRQLGTSVAQNRLDIILPIGISFYTFHTLSYTIDVYRRERHATRSFLDFSSYVAFFPQLVAGPIARAGHLLPQFEKPRYRPTTEQTHEAIWLILAGFFKKVVIADNLATIANAVYADPKPTAPAVVIGTAAFAFQIYGDFSGYSDIARGTGKLMGVDLTMNFRSPYLATGPADFWRRWHISLSTWLRDYLYVALGGNRGGDRKTYRNLAITMLLGGLWHGAAWTFVLWGAYQGTLLIAERVVRGKPPPKPKEFVFDPRTIGAAAFTFVWVCLGWMIFRATSVGQIGTMLWTLVAGPWSMPPLGKQWLIAVAVLGGMAMLIQLWEEREPEFPPRAWRVPVRVLVYGAMFYAAVILGAPGDHEFIYFQF